MRPASSRFIRRCLFARRSPFIYGVQPQIIHLVYIQPPSIQNETNSQLFLLNLANKHWYQCIENNVKGCKDLSVPPIHGSPPSPGNVFSCPPIHPLMMHFTTNHHHRNTNAQTNADPYIPPATELETILMWPGRNLTKFIFSIKNVKVYIMNRRIP